MDKAERMRVIYAGFAGNMRKTRRFAVVCRRGAGRKHPFGVISVAFSTEKPVVAVHRIVFRIGDHVGVDIQRNRDRGVSQAV